MPFHTTTIAGLKFYNAGSSRSRIVLVAPAAGAPGEPYQVAGTRWLVFGEETGRALHDLLHARSLSQLQDLLEPVGGISASTWSKLRNRWALEPGEHAHAGGCHFINFGRGNSRVLLIGPMPGKEIYPERIGDTSLVALSPAGRRTVAAFLDELPGNTTEAHAAAATTVPGGLSGRTVLRARRATSGRR